MKTLLLNSVFGHFALQSRNAIDLIYLMIFKKESIGTVANDQLGFTLITKISHSNKTFIDIGSHIGSIISEVHRSNKNVNIIGIEAIHEKVIKLKRKYPYAEIHECALGENEGITKFYVNTKKTGFSTLNKPKNIDAFETISVPMKMLDNLITSSNIDTIKIDVEGAELDVIMGGKKLIQKNRPLIFFESAPPSENDEVIFNKRKKLWQEFNNLDYIIVVPNRLAHHDKGLSIDGFIESHLYPRRTTNYFAVPLERVSEIRQRARQTLKLENFN